MTPDASLTNLNASSHCIPSIRTAMASSGSYETIDYLKLWLRNQFRQNRLVYSYASCNYLISRRSLNMLVHHYSPLIQCLWLAINFHAQETPNQSRCFRFRVPEFLKGGMISSYVERPLFPTDDLNQKTIWCIKELSTSNVISFRTLAYSSKTLEASRGRLCPCK